MHVNQSVTSGSIRYYKILSEAERPAGPAHPIAAVASRFFQRLLTSMYESRRRQAALFLTSHRHLIANAEAVSHRETPSKNRR